MFCPCMAMTRRGEFMSTSMTHLEDALESRRSLDGIFVNTCTHTHAQTLRESRTHCAHAHSLTRTGAISLRTGLTLDLLSIVQLHVSPMRTCACLKKETQVAFSARFTSHVQR